MTLHVHTARISYRGPDRLEGASHGGQCEHGRHQADDGTHKSLGT